jgi:hypothetical protein
MSNFLENLVKRSLGQTPVIEPRLPSFFETTPQGLSVDRARVWEESEGEALESPVDERAAVPPGAPRRRTPPRRRPALEQESRLTPAPAVAPTPAFGKHLPAAEDSFKEEWDEAANPPGRQVTPSRDGNAASSERPATFAVEPHGTDRPRPPFVAADQGEIRTPVEDVFKSAEPLPASGEFIPAPNVHPVDAGVPARGKRALWAERSEPTTAPQTHGDPILPVAGPAERGEHRYIGPPNAAHQRPGLANEFFSVGDLRFKPPRRSAEPPPPAAAEPAVQVTIGRLEVRAVSAPPSSAPAHRSSPVMTLSEYLRSKRGGT